MIYLLDIKLTEAKRFLLYSDHNVNEIAFRLGFEDSSYFSRIFKKKTSLTPSDFLKKYRKTGKKVL
ncbi:helix-turn-helix domain-containing protein [Viscerimonas tarda]